MHLLAFMIHFVNVLTAVGTGVRVGLILAKAKQGHGIIDVNELVNAMIFLVVQAFIYQAFLTIGAALSFPITGYAQQIFPRLPKANPTDLPKVSWKSGCQSHPPPKLCAGLISWSSVPMQGFALLR